ncbi:hypothetical protein Dsin_018362 [Dipteronia sinensis]|uniref:Uncharacterized protein n=1 Tax=Dipteronia sinensis TaxID=43782 RepID=A0AAE0A6P7_9ROSI|nr:hypothetical protein Dsin_018362 [Dipteronia sinensis]
MYNPLPIAQTKIRSDFMAFTAQTELTLVANWTAQGVRYLGSFRLGSVDLGSMKLGLGGGGAGLVEARFESVVGLSGRLGDDDDGVLNEESGDDSVIVDEESGDDR